MRLNNMNDRIVKTVLLSGKGDANAYAITPVSTSQFGIKHIVNDNTNKLINKIDLGLLFSGIPQSIVDIDFSETNTVGSDPYLTKLKEYGAVHYPDIDNEYMEEVPGELGTAFCNWKRLVGIHDLNYNEVSLSVMGGNMTIHITGSKKYTGDIMVRIS